MNTKSLLFTLWFYVEEKEKSEIHTPQILRKIQNLNLTGQTVLYHKNMA